MSAGGVTVRMPHRAPVHVPYVPRTLPPPPPIAGKETYTDIKVKIPALNQVNQAAIHQLRSGKTYANPVQFEANDQKLVSAFYACFRHHQKGEEIPAVKLETLSAIMVSAKEFDKLVVRKDLSPKIELEGGRITFSIFTCFPHSNSIMWLSGHIKAQDTDDIFMAGTGARKTPFLRAS
jgi:hypothetical protein